MKNIFFSLLFLVLACGTVQAGQVPQVVASIAPLHSLVQAVMGKTGEANLLVRGAASPHGFQLKPSQIRSLQKADLIFYISPQFETFLSKSFDILPASIKRISMIGQPGIQTLEYREGGAWDAHSAHAEDHQDEKTSEDPHIWLNPLNAMAMVSAIAQNLGEVYPENKTVFTQNATILIADIAALDQRLSKKLAPVRDRSFVVFHDAFQYFEHHYRLSAVGTILLEPDEIPSIGRLRKMRQKILESNATCVFQEPQFSKKLVQTVIEETSVKRADLDPIGAAIAPGAGLYNQMMEQVAADLLQCLD